MRCGFRLGLRSGCYVSCYERATPHATSLLQRRPRQWSSWVLFSNGGAPFSSSRMKRARLDDTLSGNAANLSGTSLHRGRAVLNNSNGATFRTRGARPPPLQQDQTAEHEEPRCAPALELLAQSCAQCNARNPVVAGRNRRERLAPATLRRQRQLRPPPQRAARGVRHVASVMAPTSRTTTNLTAPTTRSRAKSALMPLSTRAHSLHTLLVTSSRPLLRNFSPRSFDSAAEPPMEVS
jgi:hypothetical protein